MEVISDRKKYFIEDYLGLELSLVYSYDIYDIKKLYSGYKEFLNNKNEINEDNFIKWTIKQVINVPDDLDEFAQYGVSIDEDYETLEGLTNRFDYAINEILSEL